MAGPSDYLDDSTTRAHEPSAALLPSLEAACPLGVRASHDLFIKSMAHDGNGRDKNEYEAEPLSDTAMAQLFRGELSRSDTWRSRLDTTTNWALTTTAAVISFGFASPNTSHVVFLVGIWMVLGFLLIEARRYRYYDLWIRRVRLLEDGYWAPMLRREPVDPDALRELASHMERPQIQLSLFSAISTRLNRAYGHILLILTLT